MCIVAEPTASETDGNDLSGCAEGSRTQAEASNVGATGRSSTEAAETEGGAKASPSSFHVAVQHHASRADLLERLLPALDGLDVVIAEDPGGRIADPWRSHRGAIGTMPEGADGVLVIQDDALPISSELINKSFAERAVEVIGARAGEIVCLFAPGFRPITVAMLEAQKRGDQYATLPYLAFVPVVCIWYPAPIVVDLLDWADRRRCIGADDGIIARYVRERRRLPLVTVPCLVDHDDEVPSVRGGPRVRRGSHRRAALL